MEIFPFSFSFSFSISLCFNACIRDWLIDLKMKFPFVFKATETWTACVNNPRTLSFRVNPNTPDSIQRKQISDESAVIRGMRSDRLFFEPGETSSILQEAKAHASPYKETVNIMAMDSHDPFMDFRASMEEMVEAHALKDWDSLEELLTCYLKVNSKSNHAYIVAAFVDLLINLAADCSTSAIDIEPCSSSSTQYSFTSPLSFSSSSTYSSTSPCLSLLENEDEKRCSSGVWLYADEELI